MADDKKLADSKSVIDSVAWFSNVSTSVIIVFVNKALMDKNGDYRYVFGASAPLSPPPAGPARRPAAAARERSCA